MNAEPIIQMQVWNEYKGLPWEPGALTHTVVQFTDKDGLVTALTGRIRESRRKERAAAEKVMNSQGYRRRFWHKVQMHYAAKSRRLINKGRRVVLKMLRHPQQDLDLKSCFCAHETFEEVSTPGKLAELRSQVRDATRCEIWAFDG